MMKPSIRRNGTHWQVHDGTMAQHCATWVEARSWLHHRLTHRCEEDGCTLQQLPHTVWCSQHCCTYGDCGEPAWSESTILHMCPYHDHTSTLELRRQVNKRHQGSYPPRHWWYEDINQWQEIDADDMRQVRSIASQLTGEETRLLRQWPPILPSKKRQAELGIRIVREGPSRLVPKVIAFLRGDYEEVPA